MLNTYITHMLQIILLPLRVLFDEIIFYYAFLVKNNTKQPMNLIHICLHIGVRGRLKCDWNKPRDSNKAYSGILLNRC